MENGVHINSWLSLCVIMLDSMLLISQRNVPVLKCSLNIISDFYRTLLNVFHGAKTYSVVNSVPIV